MKQRDKVVKELAKKYNKDKRIIDQIVKSPFKFTNRVIRDISDDRPVRLRYFGVFTQKNYYYNKKYRVNNMVEKLLENIGDVFVVMASVLRFPVSTKEGAKNVIENARDEADYDKVKMIYDAYMEWDK